MTEFDDIFKSVENIGTTKLIEGIQRFVDEMDELSKDDKIILNWALQKGYIKDKFPTTPELIDAMVELSEKGELNPEDLPMNTFEDETEAYKAYIRFVLLPEAEESYKNKDFREPEHKSVGR